MAKMLPPLAPRFQFGDGTVVVARNGRIAWATYRKIRRLREQEQARAYREHLKRRRAARRRGEA
jgi:hypothetical protein